MPKLSVQDVFQVLAERHDLVHEDGEINRSDFSRATGIPAPTISRIIRGHETWSITADTAEALMRAFNITFEQARGEVPIKRNRAFTPTQAELRWIRDLRTLPPEVRQRIERITQDSVTLWRDELGDTISKARRAELYTGKERRKIPRRGGRPRTRVGKGGTG